MSNLYQNRIKKIRKELSKLFIEEQKEIAKIYKNAIKEIAKDIKKTHGKKTASEQIKLWWRKIYKKELEKMEKQINEQIEEQIKKGMKKAVAIGVEPTKEVMKKIMKEFNIKIKEELFDIQNSVINDIIKGDLYIDKKTLSERIWKFGKINNKNIQDIIAEGLLQQKSAVELADDLEEFVKPSAKRTTNWGKSYPHLRNKNVDYNAMRLARTATIHAYQTATIQSATMNPFVNKIEWNSMLSHRTCPICVERHRKLYNIDEVPLDHPNGMCCMLPYMSKNMDQVVNELRDWLHGKENKKLDNWYKKYGKYFSGM
jgi:hypothetical protein